MAKSATVTSNDPHNPITSISLSCFVKEHISIKPGRHIKLEGYKGDELSQKVTITATAGQEFEITEVKPVSLISARFIQEESPLLKS